MPGCLAVVMLIVIPLGSQTVGHDMVGTTWLVVMR